MNYLEPKVRDMEVLWKDDVPITGPSEFRQLIIAYEEQNSAPQMFHLYVLCGFSNGVVNGEFSVRRDTIELFSDEGSSGSDCAKQRAEQLTEVFREKGFRRLNMMDHIEIWRAERATARHGADRSLRP